MFSFKFNNTNFCCVFTGVNLIYPYCDQSRTVDSVWDIYAGGRLLTMNNEV